MRADAERDNEIYTVNGKAFDYMIHPISIQAGKPYRIYLVNMLEFDLVNSFHMHGNMYNYTISWHRGNTQLYNRLGNVSAR